LNDAGRTAFNRSATDGAILFVDLEVEVPKTPCEGPFDCAVLSRVLRFPRFDPADGLAWPSAPRRPLPTPRANPLLDGVLMELLARDRRAGCRALSSSLLLALLEPPRPLPLTPPRPRAGDDIAAAGRCSSPPTESSHLNQGFCKLRRCRVLGRKRDVSEGLDAVRTQDNRALQQSPTLNVGLFSFVCWFAQLRMRMFCSMPSQSFASLSYPLPRHFYSLPDPATIKNSSNSATKLTIFSDDKFIENLVLPSHS